MRYRFDPPQNPTTHNMNTNESDDMPDNQTTLSESWSDRNPDANSKTVDSSDSDTQSSTPSQSEYSPSSTSQTTTDTDSRVSSGESRNATGESNPTQGLCLDNADAHSCPQQTTTRPISTYATTHTGQVGEIGSTGRSTNTDTAGHTQEEKNTSSIGLKLRDQKQEDQTTAPEQEADTTKNSHTHLTPADGEMVHENCPECESEVLRESGDQYCSDCGLLIADQEIDPGPDWRAFGGREKKNKSRVGGPVKKSIHDKGLSTQISGSDKDAFGRQLNAKKKRQMSRLRKWDSRFKVKDTKERNLKQAFGEINRLCSEMELPEYVKETACTIYRRAHEEELLPGRSIESIASASVYAAMRQSGIPKTLSSLISYCRIERSRITAAYTYIGRELGMEIEPPNVTEHLSRVSSELDVMKATERKAKEIVQTSIEQKIHSGKMPSGMAAAAVYAATLITRCDRITQQEASNAGDVCELTIRTRHRELLDVCGFSPKEISPPPESVAENRTEPVDVDTFFADNVKEPSHTQQTEQVTQ